MGRLIVVLLAAMCPVGSLSSREGGSVSVCTREGGSVSVCTSGYGWRRRLLQASVAALVSLLAAVALSFVGSARAEADMVYRGSEICVAAQTYGVENPHWALGYTYFFWRTNIDFIPTCYKASRPAGYLANRVIAYKWSNKYDKWYVCRAKGYVYNQERSHSLQKILDLDLDDNGKPYCGYGYYKSFTNAYAYNGGWKGGWLEEYGYGYYGP